MRIIVGTLVAATFALTLAGCGASSTGSSQPTKLTGLQEYPSAQALADDMTKHGHACELKPTGGSMNAVDNGDCYINGKQMILSIYTSQSQIDKQISFIEDVLGNNHLEYGILVGKNWTINCGGKEVCKDLQADLGGSISAPFG